MSRLRSSLTLDHPLQRAALGTLMLGLILVIVAMTAQFLMQPAEQRVAVNFLISVIAVVGIGIYSGNTGIISFGHVSLMGVAAYSTGLLTMSPAVKASALPNLPPWLASVQMEILPAIAATVVVATVVAVVLGLPISRLAVSAAAIGTLGVLVIVNVVMVGAVDLTRGSQTFYGVPTVTSVPIALVGALIAIAVARAFRESVPGLRLRASREDELASRSMGIDVENLRLLAWVISGAVVGLSGALLAHSLGAFSPKEFYFSLTFSLLAMLIVGGTATVSGAVSGTLLVSVLIELVRRIENGATIGPIELPPLFGLTEFVLGLTILLVMYRRREGLFGRREIDEWVIGWWRARQAAAVDAPGQEPTPTRNPERRA